MSPKEVLIYSLLALGFVLQVGCVWGLLAMPHVFDRIHFLTPATSVTPLLVAGAVIARESLNHRGIMSALVAAVLLVFSPVVSHATIRAARIREKGDWRTGRHGSAHSGERHR